MDALEVVALVAFALFSWIVMPSSPEPSLLSTLLDDSEPESMLLTISELLLDGVLLPIRGMMFFPFDELID